MPPAGQIAVITGPQRSAVVQHIAEQCGLAYVNQVVVLRQFPLCTTSRFAHAHWTVSILTRPRVTNYQLRHALFHESPALFAHVAELDGEVVGCALWFLNFSTWDGVHSIYLEDLFVRPTVRGSGLGKALLVALAQECVRNGYSRLQRRVLDWKRPAIGFYRSLGAVAMDEWTVFRLTGPALNRLASA